VREWARLSEDATSHFRRLLTQLASGERVQRKKVEGGRFKKLGAADAWTARASVKHRLVFAQRGGTLEVLAFTERGSKEFYRHE
jgi:hypothetical protein